MSGRHRADDHDPQNESASEPDVDDDSHVAAARADRDGRGGGVPWAGGAAPGPLPLRQDGRPVAGPEPSHQCEAQQEPRDTVTDQSTPAS